jgi:hypothetical protein
MGVTPMKLRKNRDGSWLVPYAERHVFGKPRQLKPMALHVAAATTDNSGRFVKARAHGEVGVLIEQIVKAYHKKYALGNNRCTGSVKTPTLLQTLQNFAQAIRQDEFALNFDVAALNARAITALTHMMDACVEEFLVSYPKETYSSVSCLGAFLADLFLLYKEQGPQASGFAIVCFILDDIIEEDRGVETSGAKECMDLKWVDDLGIQVQYCWERRVGRDRRREQRNNC